MYSAQLYIRHHSYPRRPNSTRNSDEIAALVAGTVISRGADRAIFLDKFTCSRQDGVGVWGGSQRNNAVRGGVYYEYYGAFYLFNVYN